MFRETGNRQIFLGPLMIALLASWSSGEVLAKEGKKKKNRVENYQPNPGWQAHFKDDKDGRLYPLVLPMEQNKDKDWLGLQFTDYDGPKLRLAVMQVENKTGAQEQLNQDGAIGERILTLLVNPKLAAVPIGSIEELLTTSLYNTHRFDLVERKALQVVFNEQNLGQTDRVSEQTAAKVGSTLGAQYLVFSAVNEWTPEKSKMGGGGGFGGKVLGGVGLDKKNAEVAMSFRVVDSTSGQVLFSTTERATAGSWGVGFGGIGGDFGGLGGFEKNAPINYAVIACINKGAYRLAMWLNERPWSGSVIRVADDQVYVNAGSDKGIQMGMALTVLSTGDELVDPDTGLSLGAATEAIGSVMITAVNEQYSIATIVHGCAGIKRGDRVELESGEYTESAQSVTTGSGGG